MTPTLSSSIWSTRATWDRLIMGAHSLRGNAPESFRLPCDLLHVPFRSPPEGSMAVMSSNVDITGDTPFAVAARARAGNLRALAVFGPSREDSLPGVPTADEQGFGEPHPLKIFCGLIASSRASDAYVEGLRGASAQAIKDPEFVSQLRSGGVSPLSVSGADLSELMKMQSTRYAELIAALDISLT